VLSGFILGVCKPEAWTSHDAVQRLRVVLGVREVGHAGSLDPYATGVLLCGVGRGTKVLSYLMDLRKDYVGRMRLGRITDTGDATGRVLEERPVPAVPLEEARSIASRFVGRLEQIPPMVSACKHQGKRLYELARAGIEVERKPRTVEVHTFEISEIRGDQVDFRVICGKGTYVRTLAQDFGEILGPGACIEGLRRRAVGPFSEEEAVTILGEPENVFQACQRAAVPLASALSHLRALELRPDFVRRVRRGERPPWRAVCGVEECPEGKHFRLLGPEGELVALASLDPIPGPIDRPWRDSWELKLDRVI